jgi:hypothetical protein
LNMRKKKSVGRRKIAILVLRCDTINGPTIMQQ